MTELFIPSNEDYINPALLPKLTFSRVTGYLTEPIEHCIFNLSVEAVNEEEVSFCLLTDAKTTREAGIESKEVVLMPQFVQLFQEVLQKGITLEETALFQQIMDSLKKNVLQQLKENELLFLYTNERRFFTLGIGVIYDKATDLAIGTFEGLELFMEDPKLSFTINNYRMVNPANKDYRNYYYVYYSLTQQCAFYVDVEPYTYRHNWSDNQLIFYIGNGKLVPIEPEKIDMKDVEEIQLKKEALALMNEQDPLYLETKETYYSLLSQLTNKKETLERKQSIISQFDDIDF